MCCRSPRCLSPCLSSLVTLVVVLVAATIPPVSTLLERRVLALWPPHAFLSTQRLVAGAHASLLVTEACRLGVFDVLGSDPDDEDCRDGTAAHRRTEAAQAGTRGDYCSSSSSIGSSHRVPGRRTLSAVERAWAFVAAGVTSPTCMDAAAIARALRLPSADKHGLGSDRAGIGGNKDEDAEEEEGPETRLRDVLDALAALGLLTVVPPLPAILRPLLLPITMSSSSTGAVGSTAHTQKTASCYSNAAHATALLTRGGLWGSEPNTLDMCGMGIVGNHPAVLGPLARLADSLRRAPTTADRQKTGTDAAPSTSAPQFVVGNNPSDPQAQDTADTADSLWDAFARESGPFAARVAAEVAAAVLQADVLRPTTSTLSPLHVIDVGGGSGAYLEALVQAVGAAGMATPSSTAAASPQLHLRCATLLEVPAVVALHRAAHTPRVGPGTALTLVEGSMLEEQDLRRAAVPAACVGPAVPVVLLNSVLQHLDPTACAATVRRVLRAVSSPDSSKAPVDIDSSRRAVEGVLIITELSRPAGPPAAEPWLTRGDAWPNEDTFTPMARLFSPVIAAFTAGGRVRAAGFYARVAAAACADVGLECRVTQKMLLPMPATVTIVEFRTAAVPATTQRASTP